MAAYNTLPVSYLDIENYIKEATKTLMGVDQVQYIWTFKRSPTQSTKYAIDLWASAVYNLGRALALLMGFLE